MKNAKKVLLTLLFVLFLSLGISGTRVKAADYYNYSVSSPKAGAWTTASPYSFGRSGSGNWETRYYLYKISIPGNGYLKIDTESASDRYFILTGYSNGNRLSSLDNTAYTFRGAKSHYKVLPKGTYYIYNSGSNNTKFKWSFVSSKTPANYTRNKAAKLKSGAKAQIIQTYGNEFDRWYKITVKSNKAVTITTKEMDSVDLNSIWFDMWDSKGKLVDFPTKTNSGNTKIYKSGTVMKGTYYIRVQSSDSHIRNKYTENRYALISWK